jgi:hypothetical protein
MILKFYKPDHFRVEEFLPPDLYNQYGERGLELLMDPRILWTMDNLREKFGVPITVNDYHAGGQFQQRGFRNDAAVGALLSQHRYGRACDFDIKGISSEQFRHMALTGELDEELQYITRIENGVAWCHIDCAGVQSDKIIFFNA